MVSLAALLNSEKRGKKRKEEDGHEALTLTTTEVADNTYRDGSSELNNTEDSFIKDGGVSVDQRKMNAVRAYFEWMPIRYVFDHNGLVFP